MSILTITYPPTIFKYMPVEADDLENITGQIQTFHNAGGWCDYLNIKDRGLKGVNFQDDCLTSPKYAASTITTGKFADNNAIENVNIEDEGVHDSNIEYNTSWGCILVREMGGNHHPMRFNRLLMGPINFAAGETYKEITVSETLSLEGLTGSDLSYPIMTVRQTHDNDRIDAVFDDTNTKIRLLRYSDTHTNTGVYVEVMFIGKP